MCQMFCDWNKIIYWNSSLITIMFTELGFVRYVAQVGNTACRVVETKIWMGYKTKAFLHVLPSLVGALGITMSILLPDCSQMQMDYGEF